ncbi:MAG: hypothetical protein H6774_00665 [Pseudomonadales bacterium]|nr:hypothetical protein [Candidatus Woesebacteria bacterium]MCB9801579.1 hypothetical protein [Pseudomonadales bacterium]
MPKQYLSVSDLRSRGVAVSAAYEKKFCEGVNAVIAKAVEEELKTEIAVNHGEDMLALYAEMLNTYGFSSNHTQRWLESTIPALGQIEIEWSEIALHHSLTKTPQVS